ncbi:hypothetical protein UFOVP45_50 [uncultured Caudovirales phage]|uniref:Uncharacterized protein n=1 Tax=uncultured Caudovirales phage TaxID=2100421 RepID=A0A6J5KUJ8_9CAUD|nr:hypothetical protein UFOVP45_50 [uncultured Caudovirales phage]
MARYSNSKYQEAYYGADISKLPGSVEPVLATAISYSQIRLEWTTAPGAGTAYTALRIIRNQDEYPETEEDGVIIYEVVINDGSPPYTFDDGLQYTDIPLSGGRYVYYAIWIRNANTNTWEKAGVTNVLLPKQHTTNAPDNSTLLTTQDKFVALLPKMYTTSSQSPLDEIDTTSALYNFLSAFTFTIDELYTFIDLLLPDASGRFVNPNVVGAALDNVGLSQPSRLVTKNQKRMLREAIYIYNRKGTALSLGTLVESMTGFAPTITLSPNLMLTNQDSTFNGGIGSWKVKGDGEILLEQTVLPPSDTNAIDTNYTAKVIARGDGVHLQNGIDNPILYGVPVTAGAEYYLIWQHKATSIGNYMYPLLNFYDCYGQFLEPIEVYNRDIPVATSWTSMRVPFTAPAAAAYASIDFALDAGTYYFDMFEIIDVTNGQDYHEAREVSVFLNPTKSNFIENPSFYPTTDMDDTDWAVVATSSSFVTPTTLQNVHDGSHMLQVVAKTSGTTSITARSYGNMGQSFYTFSIYVQTTSGSENMSLVISALDTATNSVLKTKSLPITVGTTWERHQVTLDATSITGDFKFEVSVSGTTIGNTLNFDASQLEAAYLATDYFDGSVATTGAVWEENANDSYSHQYPNKEVKIPLLVEALYNNLPINTPYRITMFGADPITGYTR